MTRLEETREALMDALAEWYDAPRPGWLPPNTPEEDQLIDAYAAYERAMNGEPEDDHT